MNWKDVRMRAYPMPRIPRTAAGRIEQIMAWLHPPLYCDCKPDCDVVVGEGAPLISRELAAKLLDVPYGLPGTVAAESDVDK